MFWEREASYWLPFEKELIQEYARLKSNARLTIRGYVNWIRFEENIFALTPTQHTGQVHLVCKNLTDNRPNPNSYIEVEGYTKRRILGSRSYRRRELSVFDGELILHVESWHKTSPDYFYYKDPHEFYGLSSDFTLVDYKRDLLTRVEGLEPAIEDFLAFSSLSAPAFGPGMWQSGGINLTLYDSTESGLSRIVLDELKGLLPSDMNRVHSVNTPFGKFGLRHSMAFLMGSVDRPLPTRIDNCLTRSVKPEYDEVSLGLFSKSRQPISFSDKACAFGDIVTVIPETTDVFKSKKIELDPDTFKYMLAHQMLRPEIENPNAIINSLGTMIEKLRESFGLNALQLTQYGFLNANYYARPSQILRQALSFSRAHKNNVVELKDVDQVFEDYFRWNFEYVYDIWEDQFKTRTSSLPDKAEYGKIRRIIRKYDQGIGVDERVIINETGFKPEKTLRLIAEMRRHGWIFDKSYKKWRLTFG